MKGVDYRFQFNGISEREYPVFVEHRLSSYNENFEYSDEVAVAVLKKATVAHFRSKVPEYFRKHNAKLNDLQCQIAMEAILLSISDEEFKI